MVQTLFSTEQAAERLGWYARRVHRTAVRCRIGRRSGRSFAFTAADIERLRLAKPAKRGRPSTTPAKA